MIHLWISISCYFVTDDRPPLPHPNGKEEICSIRNCSDELDFIVSMSKNTK